MSGDGLCSYTVTLRAVIERDVDVRAASPEEAARLASERRDGLGPVALRAEWVHDAEEDEGFDVLGRCEVCEAWLLEGRDEGQSVDDDGVMLCTPCVAKAVKAAREERGS